MAQAYLTLVTLVLIDLIFWSQSAKLRLPGYLSLIGFTLVRVSKGSGTDQVHFCIYKDYKYGMSKSFNCNHEKNECCLPKLPMLSNYQKMSFPQLQCERSC